MQLTLLSSCSDNACVYHAIVQKSLTCLILQPGSYLYQNILLLLAVVSDVALSMNRAKAMMPYMFNLQPGTYIKIHDYNADILGNQGSSVDVIFQAPL